MDNYTKWTDEEWASVAKRAAALKASRPDMSWTQIVPVCQDDIAPERRRFSINKLSGLKQMFDILDLDEQGNPKPPPPPPPPAEPEPQPEAAVASLTPPFAVSKLSDVPMEQLIAEVFSRASVLKEQVDLVLNTKTAILGVLEENKVKLDAFMKRVDDVEAYTLQCMEGMDKINATYQSMIEADKKMVDLMRQAGLMPKGPARMEDILGQGIEEKQDKTPRIMPTRVLVVGLLQKEMTRIKERLPRHLNIELIHGENSEHVVLPANISFALVSGHADCTRRWQTILAHYGDKAHRMANGSIGTFVHAIEELCALRG